VLLPFSFQPKPGAHPYGVCVPTVVFGQI
jgi:hypothetical protein